MSHDHNHCEAETSSPFRYEQGYPDYLECTLRGAHEKHEHETSGHTWPNPGGQPYHLRRDPMCVQRNAAGDILASCGTGGLVAPRAYDIYSLADIIEASEEIGLSTTWRDLYKNAAILTLDELQDRIYNA